MSSTAETPWLSHTRIALFAVLAEKAGKDQVDVPIPPGSTARSVLSRLAWQEPKLAAYLGGCRLARDNEFLQADDPVIAGDTLSVIPPTSGG